jgi:hypothetical protein
MRLNNGSSIYKRSSHTPVNIQPHRELQLVLDFISGLHPQLLTLKPKRAFRQLKTLTIAWL